MNIGTRITAFMINRVYAQELIPCPDGTYADPSIGCVITPTSVVRSEASITDVILNIASALMGVVAIMATLMLIYGAIQYAMAAGDEEKIQKAKRLMIWSIAGLGVAIVAKMVVQSVLGAVT